MNSKKLVNAMRNISIVFVIALLVCTVSCDMFFHTWWEHNYKYTEDSTIIFMAISGILALALLGIIRYYERNNKAVTRKEKLTLLIQNSCSGSITDITFVLAFLIFLNLLPATVINYIDGKTPIFSVLIYIMGIACLIYGKPTFRNVEPVKDEERKVLVSGISKVSLIDKNNEIKSNLEPIFKPFEVFPNIEKVAILLSNDIAPIVESLKIVKNKKNEVKDKEDEVKDKEDEVKDKEDEVKDKEIHDELAILSKGYIENYKNSNDKDKKEENKNNLIALFQACIKTYPLYKDKKVDIEFSNEVDYNSFKGCNDESVRFIKEEMGKRYEDKNIIVNITPGTKILTGVMTLNAIKGERLMIYIGQKDNNLIKDQTPSVSLIQFTDWKKDIEKLG